MHAACCLFAGPGPHPAAPAAHAAQVLVGVRQVEVKDYEVGAGGRCMGRRPKLAPAGRLAATHAPQHTAPQGTHAPLFPLLDWGPHPRCMQIMHSYRLTGPGAAEGRQRSCLYLQPQEERFFQAAGRAVAVYDYRFSMRRLPPPGDAPSGAAACVQTPKAVWQCV